MTMINILALIGTITVTGLGIIALFFVADFILDRIHEAVWVYKYKHRFDKPPTAACYCIDCKFHGDTIDRTRCTRHEDIIFYTADEWFCKLAKPKEMDK